MHLGKIPKKTFPRKPEDVGQSLWKDFLCGITTVIQDPKLVASGQSGPQFLKTQNLWRSLVVLPAPGRRFKYSLQAQHQHLGVFRWPKQNGGLVMSEALMKLEIAPYLCLPYRTVQLFVVYKFELWRYPVSCFGGYAKKPLEVVGLQLPTSTGS